MKKLYLLLFIALSLLSLFIVEYDYTCGHMGVNPFKPDECPLCASFSSTEFIPLFLYLILFLGMVQITGIVTVYRCPFIPDFFFTAFTGRSPPRY